MLSLVAFLKSPLGYIEDVRDIGGNLGEEVPSGTCSVDEVGVLATVTFLPSFEAALEGFLEEYFVAGFK